jgi:hypothetical protein
MAAANPLVNLIKSTLKASESAADNGIFKTIFSKGTGSVIRANSDKGAEIYLKQLENQISSAKSAIDKSIAGGGPASVKIAGRAIDQAGLDAISTAHTSLKGAFEAAGSSTAIDTYGNISAAANKLGSRYFGDGSKSKHWLDSAGFSRTRGILGRRSGFESTGGKKAFASNLYSDRAPEGFFENINSYFMPRLSDGTIDKAAMIIRGGAAAIAGGTAMGLASNRENRFGGAVVGAALGTGLTAGTATILGKL